jgi:hypothetical protein
VDREEKRSWRREVRTVGGRKTASTVAGKAIEGRTRAGESDGSVRSRLVLGEIRLEEGDGIRKEKTFRTKVFMMALVGKYSPSGEARGGAE